MSWLSKLFGGKADTQRQSPDSTDKDDIYALAWRNRYLISRIQHLDKQIKKRKFAGVISFEMPDGTQSGTEEELKALNEMLEARVKYLEGFFTSS